MVGEVVFFSVVLCVGADVVGDGFTTVEFCPRASANQWLDLRKMKRGGEVENTEKRGGGGKKKEMLFTCTRPDSFSETC